MLVVPAWRMDTGAVGVLVVSSARQQAVPQRGVGLAARNSDEAIRVTNSGVALPPGIEQVMRDAHALQVAWKFYVAALYARWWSVTVPIASVGSDVVGVSCCLPTQLGLSNRQLFRFCFSDVRAKRSNCASQHCCSSTPMRCSSSVIRSLGGVNCCWKVASLLQR